MRCLKTETFLDRRNAKWNYHKSVAISKIDIKGSLKNQARFDEVLCQEIVDRYAAAMKAQGGDFAPVILVLIGTMYRVISGNHRVAAALQIGMVSVEAYVVDTIDKQEIDLLTMTANTIEGKRQSTRDDAQNALRLVEDWGMTQAEACAQFGISETTLRDVIVLSKVNHALDSAGFPAHKIESETVRRRLKRLMSDRKVMVGAAKIIFEKRLSTKDSQFFIDEVERAVDFDAKQEVLNRWSAANKDNRSIRGPMGSVTRKAPIDLVIRKVVELARLLDQYKAAVKIRNPDEAAQLGVQWNAVSAIMSDILKRSQSGGRAEKSNGVGHSVSR